MPCIHTLSCISSLETFTPTCVYIVSDQPCTQQVNDLLANKKFVLKSSCVYKFNGAAKGACEKNMDERVRNL